MRKKRPLTLFLFFLILSTDALETVAQFCFKKTALVQHSTIIASLPDALHFVFVSAVNPFLWFALFALAIYFCLWITILSKIDLSVAMPVASFSYITIPLISIIFFGEKIPVLRWMGIGFILLGVILVSLSSHRQGGEA
ncbi:MAG: EamA family transporter [Candidatus Paceibacterota bacterium]|jgi:drug/metabolite transporter (DMT)-like permease|nr:EamA family transporter [Candidatus Omnitrophota bacterium]